MDIKFYIPLCFCDLEKRKRKISDKSCGNVSTFSEKVQMLKNVLEIFLGGEIFYNYLVIIHEYMHPYIKLIVCCSTLWFYYTIRPFWASPVHVASLRCCIMVHLMFPSSDRCFSTMHVLEAPCGPWYQQLDETKLIFIFIRSWSE